MPLEVTEDSTETCPGCEGKLVTTYTFAHGVTLQRVARWEGWGLVVVEEKAIRIVQRCSDCGWVSVRKG